ncbi:MAG: selenobiotic family peptide radical SAM maturase [Proteobacteria bacterium]|nr:selenobiotic family peptide radical SAM maturase [Pseudomonadota bacterium]MBU1650161.1 selenobiotic family peptide radical SAM maturase [Pseudomonadota bacterium]
MSTSKLTHLSTLYPITSRFLPPDLGFDTPHDLSGFIRNRSEICPEYPFLADLAAIEYAQYWVSKIAVPDDEVASECIVNPALEIVPVHWHHLLPFLGDQTIVPEMGDSWILVFKRPGTEIVQTITASGHDLLALKIVSEKIDSREAANLASVTVGVIDDILAAAVRRGLLLAPGSLLVRPDSFPCSKNIDPRYFSAPTFTLQWHITQDCDLHCRHCYDRSDRKDMELSQGIRVLDDLYDFCQAHHVFTQVTFTGGNPLLYPHFNELYKEAADRGFMTAVLGNPMPRKRMEEILALQQPEFYQVSLEGMRAQNDYIRGVGHFDRTLDFLDLLRELGIYSMVMLTLTRANMDEVLELAELLRGRVDLFTFNRLAMVGEGADLASVAPEVFPGFLQEYLQAAAKNPAMGVKDNLFNLLRHEQAIPYRGGCAGYGCGAGFNFVSLLPDGEVHACRKLPSLIGNMYQQPLGEIYHGSLAEQYRQGSAACQDCEIRPVCGGCLAVAYGYGRNIFRDVDPYCWKITEKLK